MNFLLWRWAPYLILIAALLGVFAVSWIWGENNTVFIDFHTNTPVGCMTEQSRGHKLGISDQECQKLLTVGPYDAVLVDGVHWTLGEGQ